MEEKTEGIILQTVPYLSKGAIVKIFSPSGLISFFVKHISTKKRSYLMPLSQIEIVYRKKEGLYLALDLSLVNHNLELRHSFECMDAAGKMVKALITSQMQEKSAPDLYLLLDVYLKKLPSFQSPGTLLDSFLLKLLIHEGLLHLSPLCTTCSSEALFLSDGESHCQSHAQIGAHSFTATEFSSLLILTFSRRFSELSQIPPLSSKVQKLFSELIQ